MDKKTSYKYYEIVAKCAHCPGRYKSLKYVPVSFPVYAKSAKDAAEIVNTSMPRVKKGMPGAILKVTEISQNEFQMLNERNNKDPYLICHNRTEEKRLNFQIESRIQEDEIPHWLEKEDESISKRQIKVKKTTIRRPKIWVRMNAIECDSEIS